MTSTETKRELMQLLDVLPESKLAVVSDFAILRGAFCSGRSVSH